MLGFGLFGYFLRTYGFQVGPVVLGMILGPLMDTSYRRAMISAGDEPVGFLMDFVASPLSLTLALAVVVLVASQTPAWRRMKGRLSRG
jgi:putative tricarboxylic transport membrane protein